MGAGVIQTGKFAELLLLVMKHPIAEASGDDLALVVGIVVRDCVPACNRDPVSGVIGA